MLKNSMLYTYAIGSRRLLLPFICIFDPLLSLIVAGKQSRLLSNMCIWLCSAKNQSRLSLFYNFILHFPLRFSPCFPFICIFEDASLTLSWVLLWQANSQGYSPTCVFGCAVQKTVVVCLYSIIFSFIFAFDFVRAEQE